MYKNVIFYLLFIINVLYCCDVLVINVPEGNSIKHIVINADTVKEWYAGGDDQPPYPPSPYIVFYDINTITDVRSYHNNISFSYFKVMNLVERKITFNNVNNGDWFLEIPFLDTICINNLNEFIIPPYIDFMRVSVKNIVKKNSLIIDNFHVLHFPVYLLANDVECKLYNSLDSSTYIFNNNFSIYNGLWNIFYER